MHVWLLDFFKIRQEDRKAPAPAGGAHVREGQDRVPVGQRAKGEAPILARKVVGCQVGTCTEASAPLSNISARGLSDHQRTRSPFKMIK